MRLTKKKAIDWTKEIWAECAERGCLKEKNEALERIKADEYGSMQSNCPLCEYDSQFGDDCTKCPYHKKFKGCGEEDSPFYMWCLAETDKKRKKYAAEFLAQLMELR